MAPYESVMVSDGSQNESVNVSSTSTSSFAFMIFLVIIASLCILMILLKFIIVWQKTREPQQRRMYVGSRVRTSIGHQQSPTIYVSPSNLPPPPKYEVMAPPSYEEVCGIHYPNYQPPMTRAVPVQPITQPILTAVAQSANQSDAIASQSTNQDTASFSPGIPMQSPEYRLNQGNQSTVITVSTDDSRTSVTVANQQV